MMADFHQRTRNAETHYPIREFIVEFFGVLLPGFAFTAGLLPILVFPVFALVIALPESVVNPSNYFADPQMLQTFDEFKIVIIVSVAAFSFVWGYVFYRSNPQLPDTISYWSLPCKHREDDPVGRMHEGTLPKLTPKRIWHHLGEAMFLSRLYSNILGGKHSRYRCLVDFPYVALKNWFDSHAMYECARLVSWSEQGGRQGTIHLISLMKAALEFTFPEQYTRIAHNEAQVRMLCSIWYASCYLISLSVVGLIASVAANVLPVVGSGSGDSLYIAVLLVQLAALWGLLKTKYSVEQSLHSVRIRELVFLFGQFGCGSKLVPELLDVLPQTTQPGEERAVMARMPTLVETQEEPRAVHARKRRIIALAVGAGVVITAVGLATAAITIGRV